MRWARVCIGRVKRNEKKLAGFEIELHPPPFTLYVPSPLVALALSLLNAASLLLCRFSMLFS